MYEYQTTVFYGQTPPALLVPPQPEFRLRDLKCVITSTTESNTINDRFSSGNGFSVSIPFVQSSNRGHNHVWVAIWERYKGNE